jgi:hypothetical protein
MKSIYLDFVTSKIKDILLFSTFFLFACTSLNQPRGNSLQQAQKMSKEKLSQRLHEMNEQFDAIEQLTSNMEQDLQRSNRVRIQISTKTSLQIIYFLCVLVLCTRVNMMFVVLL